MNLTQPKPLASVTNRHGETFELNWRKWIERPDTSYRFYVVVAQHKKWGEMPFSVWVTKAMYPSEQHALSLIQGDALQVIRSRLDEVTGDGRPMYLPDLKEGWTLVS